MHTLLIPTPENRVVQNDQRLIDQQFKTMVANGQLGEDPGILQLTDEQILAARLEAASHQPGKSGGAKQRVWAPETNPELEVKVDSDPETLDDMVYTARVYVNPDDQAAGHYEAVVTPDGVRITQPGDGRQEAVTDPQRRKVLVGGFADKLQDAIDSTTEASSDQGSIFSALGRIMSSDSELREAA